MASLAGVRPPLPRARRGREPVFVGVGHARHRRLEAVLKFANPLLEPLDLVVVRTRTPAHQG